MARKKQTARPRSAYQRLQLRRKQQQQMRLWRVSLSIAVSVGILAVCLITLHSSRVNAPQKELNVMQQLPALSFSNDVEQRMVTELRSFGEWLTANQALGFIGELGWPDRPADSAAWNAAAAQWYKEAAYHKLWATAWAAGSWWGDYPMTIYKDTAGAPGLDAAGAQAAVVEANPSRDGRLLGVNLAGMEFGTDSGFSNTNPGTAGTNYFHEPADSLAYLSKRGIKLVRLPLRWERIQPALGGGLNPAEVQAIRGILDAAEANGIEVVLDLHNYGGYKIAAGELLLGTTLPHERLSEVWLQLSKVFKNHPALAAYGLMNEPHDLSAGAYGSPARNWEAASQSTLSALRQADDDTLVMVAGYDWSSTARWAQNHPKGWITDPAHNFRYEAHHYWDTDGSGHYPNPFGR